MPKPQKICVFHCRKSQGLIPSYLYISDYAMDYSYRFHLRFLCIFYFLFFTTFLFLYKSHTKKSLCSFNAQTPSFSILSALFYTNITHFLPLLFHISHQCKLGSASVKIVFFSCGFKIGISLQIISQETHATF